MKPGHVGVDGCLEELGPFPEDGVEFKVVVDLLLQCGPSDASVD